MVARVRAREYPDASPGIFFNAASWGLIPRSAAEEATEFTLRRNLPRGIDEPELGRIQRRCRRALAELLAVSPREIALVPNTSFGVNLGAALVGVGPPGTVVVSDGEFPANVLPWKALTGKGFRLRIVPSDARGLPREEEILAALDGEDVRALALSAVQFSNGYLADLERLGTACRERDILFCVDAIQALGAVPLHPRDSHVDIMASGGQKWLCSPFGSGFAYVRRELQERFDPPMVSWLSMEGATDFDDQRHYRMAWVDGARKFELATHGVQDYLALARSVEIFLEMGVDAVRRHVHAVHEPLLRWMEGRDDVTPVTPLDPARRAGIVSLVLPGLEATASALADAGVVFAVREGAIRFAPHFYNTVEEMEEVVEILKKAVGG